MMGRMEVSAELVKAAGAGPLGSYKSNNLSFARCLQRRKAHFLAEVEASERILASRGSDSTTAPSGLVDAKEVILQSVVEGALLVEARVQSLEIGRDGAVSRKKFLMSDLWDLKVQHLLVESDCLENSLEGW